MKTKSKELKAGDKVVMLSRRKSSQTWYKRGFVRAISWNKALVEWIDRGALKRPDSWTDITQLTKHKWKY